MFPDGGPQGGAPQVGVDDDPGGVDHPSERGPAGTGEGLGRLRLQRSLIKLQGQAFHGQGQEAFPIICQKPANDLRRVGTGQRGQKGREAGGAQQLIHRGDLAQQASAF